MTEGGKLKLPKPSEILSYIPSDISPQLTAAFKADIEFDNAHMDEMMGCTFSSILCHAFPDLPPNIGLVDEHICMQYYEKLVTLGIQAASLQYEYRILDPVLIQSFYECYQEKKKVGALQSLSINCKLGPWHCLKLLYFFHIQL